jgi:hypothetical protein
VKSISLGVTNGKVFYRGASRRPLMIEFFATAGVLLGATLAYQAGRFQRHQAALETIAGLLLIGGFGLFGYALSCAFGCP